MIEFLKSCIYSTGAFSFQSLEKFIKSAFFFRVIFLILIDAFCFIFPSETTLSIDYKRRCDIVMNIILQFICV